MSSFRGTVIIRPDKYTDGTLCYVAQSDEAPGCFGYGSTPDEAMEKFIEALEAYRVVDEHFAFEGPGSGSAVGSFDLSITRTHGSGALEPVTTP